VCQSFMLLHPRQGHNNGPKTANSNRLIWLENPRLPARIPERSYRHFWQQNQGNPVWEGLAVGEVSREKLQHPEVAVPQVVDKIFAQYPFVAGESRPPVAR
jgi:hypothetical protein